MKRLLVPHNRKLLVDHGLTPETISAAGLYSADALELNGILGRKDIKCEGIVIPYSGGYSRVRLNITLVLGNRERIKYLSPSGSKNRLYIPKLVKPLLLDPSTPIYITEGEFKALKLTQEGFPCIGLPGAWGTVEKRSYFPTLEISILKGGK